MLRGFLEKLLLDFNEKRTKYLGCLLGFILGILIITLGIFGTIFVIFMAFFGYLFSGETKLLNPLKNFLKDRFNK